MRNLKKVNKTKVLGKEHTQLKLKVQSIQNHIKSTFPLIKLEEETHTYKVDGSVYIPTTTFLKQFSNDFNSFHICNNIHKSLSKEENKKVNRALYCSEISPEYTNSSTPENLIMRYKFNSEAALMLGKRVHLFAEYYPYFPKPICELEEGVISFYKALDKNRYIVLFTELKVYDKKYKKAGTIDVLLYDIVTNSLVIVDWKTGNKCLLENKYKKKMLGTFKLFYDVAINKYSLQLSDYKNMIEMNTKLVVSEKWVIHLGKKNVALYKQMLKGTDLMEYKDVEVKKDYLLYKCRDMSVPLRMEYERLNHKK